MAINTTVKLRNQVMYSIFVRQYSKEGTFAGVKRDLDRIRSLGVDVIWLMPIHPIGLKNRKGELGSPYAIQDYRKVNPEFGTLDDFRCLIDGVHQRGMKCIIDVVYNHTSPDSWLAKHHPEWFFHQADGSFGNRIGEWSDIIDLDYSQKDLWKYQIETLKYWATMVDGFRCDVAPLVPLEFWLRARKEVETVRPGCLWLSETVEPVFTMDNRERGMISLSDGEIFQAFDLSYEYDVYHEWVRCLCGEIPLLAYAQRLNDQEHIYPENYVKLRFLENHDRPRAAFLIPNEKIRRNWTAFLYFRKGMVLLYNGQETANDFRPSLFERDPVNWNTGRDISEELRALYHMKQHPLIREGRFEASDAGHGILCASYRKQGRKLYGFFSTQGESGVVRCDLPEGVYANQLGGSAVRVESGFVSCKGEPIVIGAEN